MGIAQLGDGTDIGGYAAPRRVAVEPSHGYQRRPLEERARNLPEQCNLRFLRVKLAIAWAEYNYQPLKQAICVLKLPKRRHFKGTIEPFGDAHHVLLHYGTP